MKCKGVEFRISLASWLSWRGGKPLVCAKLSALGECYYISIARRLSLAVILLLLFYAPAFSQIPLDSLFTQVEEKRLAAQTETALALLEGGKEQAVQVDRFPEWQIWKAKCLSDTDARQSALDLLTTAKKKLKLPKDDLLLAEAVNIQGSIAFRQNQLSAAEQYYREALGIRETYLGPTSEKVADGYNNLGAVFYLRQQYDEAIFYHQQALTIRLGILESPHPDLGSSYNNIAACFYDLGQIDQALSYNQEALTQRMGRFGERHPSVADSYNNLGNCYFDLYQLDLAITQHEKALSIRRALQILDGEAASYNNLGNCWLEYGDYQRAVQYFNQSIQLYEQVYGSDHPSIAEVAVNQGTAYLEIGDFSNALGRFELARFIIEQQLGAASPNRIPALLGQASALQQLGSFEAAIPLFQEAIGQIQQQLGAEHPLLPEAYNNLGNCFFRQENYGPAREYYQKAGLIFQNQGGSAQTTASTIFNIGNTYFEDDEAAKALRYYEQATRLLTANHSLSSLFFKVKLAKAMAYAKMGKEDQAKASLAQEAEKMASSEASPRPEWIDVLVQLGDFYQEEGNSLALEKALHAYEKAAAYLDQILIFNRSLLAKRQIRIDYFRLYEKGIRVALQLSETEDEEFYREKAFQLSEKSKALLIREASNEAEARNFAQVPDSLLEKGANLRQQIAEYEQLLYEQGDQLDSATTRLVEVELLNLRENYNQLVAALEVNFPDYFQMKYQSATVSLAEVQSQLGTEKGILSYFLGDSTVFVFSISKARLEVLSYPKADLNRMTIQLWDAISHFTSAQAADDYTLYAQQYVRNAHQLFLQLLAPVEALGTLPEELTIVPDGVLCYLPFDLLLREAVDSSSLFRFGQHAYLIKDYQLSYAYSVSQWAKAFQAKAKRKQVRWVGFAPSFNKEVSRFEPLYFNDQEIRNIAKVLPGDHLFIGGEASLAAFEIQSSRPSILHLATHGLANANQSDFSFLAFAAKDSTEQLLYTQNLYAMDLDEVELVVLSACETGLGEALPGEGVMSLAHAFRYAGAKSIITTLWSIDDEKTANIMLYFYQNLKKGKNKDEALRQARLQYLEENNGEYAHPYFWAAFVPIGEMGAVSFYTNVTYLIALGVFVSFLILLIAYRNRQKAKKKD